LEALDVDSSRINSRNIIKGRSKHQGNASPSQQCNSNCIQEEVDPVDNPRDSVKGRSKV
jgi:hypothetical protein